MQELIRGLFVGNIDDYNRSQHRAVISATKTVHLQEVSYSGKDDPAYIYLFRPYHAILNWVDGPAHLYEWSSPSLFTRLNDFLDQHLKHGDVLVHCDQGLSRAPTVCMVYLAKRKGLGGGDFNKAAEEFQRDYFPEWLPGGIFDFVAARWSEIR